MGDNRTVMIRTTPSVRKPTLREARALIILYQDGAYDAEMGCCTFGADYFGPERVGRVSASGGGGDYAAQMVLGRLRRLGWVELAYSLGSSRWRCSVAGRSIARWWIDRSAS